MTDSSASEEEIFEDPEGEQLVEDSTFPPSAHLQLIYAEIKNRLEVQRTELDDLQRIVAIVLATTGVVLGFAGSQFPTKHPNHLEFALFVAAVVVLAVDAVVGVLALWPRDVKATAEPGPLVDDYIGAATNVMLFDLIAAARTAFDENEGVGVRRWRSRFVRGQLVLLGLGAMCLGTGVMAPHL